MRGAYRIALSFARAVRRAGNRTRTVAGSIDAAIRRMANGTGRGRAPAISGDDPSASRGPGFFGWFSGTAAARSEALQTRPRRRLTWPLRLLPAASLGVPLVLLAIAAGQNYRLVQIEAEQRVRIETGQLHEHARSA